MTALRMMHAVLVTLIGASMVEKRDDDDEPTDDWQPTEADRRATREAPPIDLDADLAATDEEVERAKRWATERLKGEVNES